MPKRIFTSRSRVFSRRGSSLLYVTKSPAIHIILGKRSITLKRTLFAAGISMAMLLVSHVSRADEKESVTFTPLFSIPDDSKILSKTSSQDGHHLAWITTQGSEQVVVVDGQPRQEVGSVLEGSLMLSADG